MTKWPVFRLPEAISVVAVQKPKHNTTSSLSESLPRLDLLGGLWPVILLGMLSLVQMGAGADVRIRLETTDLNSNVVTSVNVGEQFLLRGYVTDLRTNAKGVYASYLNLAYSPAGSVSVTGAVTFVSPYINATSEKATNPGSIQELGSSAGFTPTGAGEKPQFNVRFRANAPGMVSFTGSPAEAVAYGVLLYGLNTFVPTNEIQFVNTTIVVKDSTIPTLRITRIDVNTNGAQLTLSGPRKASIQVQYLTNLTHTAWQDVGASVLLGTDGMGAFYDPSATNDPIRYYRAYQP